MRELREFRAHYAELRAHGLTAAGVAREPVDVNHKWAERLSLPYPILADPDGVAGTAFGVTRRIGIGAWKLEFFRRSTFLIDLHGVVAAVWGDVKIRGHVREILALAEALEGPGESPRPAPPPIGRPHTPGATG